jgi:hypothetical protein
VTWGDVPRPGRRVPGSLPPMRPDQAAQAPRTRAGSGPAPSSAVVVARLVIVNGGIPPGSGFYLYDANRDLLVAISGTGGTGPLGGAVKAGIYQVRADGARAVQIFNGLVEFWNLADPPIVTPNIQAGGGGSTGSELLLASGQSQAGATQATLTIADSLNEPLGVPMVFFNGAFSPNLINLTQAVGAGGLLVVQNQSGTPTAPTTQLIAAVAADRVLGIEVAGDANFRWRIDANGLMVWGPGSAGVDTSLGRSAANTLQLLTADLDIGTIGRGVKIAEGSNARMGVSAAMVAGTITIANTSVTASTRVFLSHAVTGGALGHLSRTVIAGTSFTINSSSNTDTSTVNWLLIEPG